MIEPVHELQIGHGFTFPDEDALVISKIISAVHLNAWWPGTMPDSRPQLRVTGTVGC
jgi:hypothetical protein